LRKRVYATQETCGVCGGAVDKTLPSGTPMSPELDEIMPVARGGSPYDIDNLQLNHRVCNRRKGTKIASDKLPPDINTTPNSRVW
jgi:5-methylcytosine-specific restriction endonuclease McrA